MLFQKSNPGQLLPDRSHDRRALRDEVPIVLVILTGCMRHSCTQTMLGHVNYP
jgi:hypothetical protein